MSLSQALRARPITRLGDAGPVTCDDAIAIEEPLEIRVNGKSVAVVMRTPGHDRELAAGFLVAEGLLRTADDVLDLVRCAATDARARENMGNVIDVLLAPGVAADLERLTRHVFTSSSCGLCSKATIEAVQAHFPPLTARTEVTRAVLETLPDQLRAAQAGFAASGGLHASAIFDSTGRLELLREDVGRHNALDKVIGHAFLARRWPLSGRILLVSGRVSFELMQKALAAGIGCVAAISAPTTAAVELAEAGGQTLVGFLRGSRMNVYAGTLAG